MSVIIPCGKCRADFPSDLGSVWSGGLICPPCQLIVRKAYSKHTTSTDKVFVIKLVDQSEGSQKNVRIETLGFARTRDEAEEIVSRLNEKLFQDWLAQPSLREELQSNFERESGTDLVPPKDWIKKEEEKLRETFFPYEKFHTIEELKELS